MLLPTSSETSGVASANDPRTALLLQQLLQERQNQADGQRFLPG